MKMPILPNWCVTSIYRNYVQDGIDIGRRPELVGGGLIRSLGGWSAVKALRRAGNRELSDERILGSGEFVEQILKKTEGQVKYQLPVKASGALFSESPGQAVELDPANERYIVTNTSGGNLRIAATFDETQKNLAATTEIPINLPKVVDPAKQAVSGAHMSAEKAARLVRFVHLYIEDDLSADPLTLLDVIARRKGDCSEHAPLFTALARALGTLGKADYLC